MNLNEWNLMSKPASNSSGSFKKRFEKLIKYHIDHASSELESITKKDIKDTYFRLSEHYNNSHHEFDRDLVVSYDKDSDTFMFRIFIDGKEVDNILRKGYENFVTAIEPYMFLPDSGTQEYDDLLVEWVAMKNSNTSSQPASGKSKATKTNKEKFKELTDYMKNHKSSLATKAEVTRLDEGGFTYEETWYSSALKQDFILAVVVDYSRFNSSWGYKLYMDTNLIKEAKGSGWEALLEELEKHFHVPKAGTTEYKSLTEWVEMKSSKASSKVTKTNKERFIELLKYMIDHKLSSVVTFDASKLDEDGFTYRELRQPVGLDQKYELVSIVNYGYGQTNSSWQVSVYKNGRHIDLISGEGWEELLAALDIRYNVPAPGSPEHKSICESYSSIAEDFKEYENLWN